MSGCLCDDQKGMPDMRIFKAVRTDKKVSFTAPDWAIKLPEGEKLHREPVSIECASWWLENSNDHDDLWDDEFVRDEMVRLGLGYFHWLKNSAPLKPITCFLAFLTGNTKLYKDISAYELLKMTGEYYDMDKKELDYVI